MLIEHEAVAEAAVVPVARPGAARRAEGLRRARAPAGEPTAETAAAILGTAASTSRPYKRIRRLEFAELPKTISGKIRRVELRAHEEQTHGGGQVSAEFREEDFPDLKH